MTAPIANSPDSVGRHKLLQYLCPFTAPGPDATPQQREDWAAWLRSPEALKKALNRAIELELKLAKLEPKADAWDAVVKLADHSAVSDFELSGDMPAPNKWLAMVGLLDGGFLEGLQAASPEQAVVNLAESFSEWHRDTFESCLEDG